MSERISFKLGGTFPYLILFSKLFSTLWLKTGTKVRQLTSVILTPRLKHSEELWLTKKITYLKLSCYFKRIGVTKLGLLILGQNILIRFHLLPLCSPVLRLSWSLVSFPRSLGWCRRGGC